MKKGNQFYLEIQLTDKDDNLIDITNITKVQFIIGDLVRTYDGENEEVTYEDGIFKIWLTEQETFAFDDYVGLDARILFNDNTILGACIRYDFFFDVLKEVNLDDTDENNE